jgi:hypothetical protein
MLEVVIQGLGITATLANSDTEKCSPMQGCQPTNANRPSTARKRDIILILISWGSSGEMRVSELFFARIRLSDIAMRRRAQAHLNHTSML